MFSELIVIFGRRLFKVFDTSSVLIPVTTKAEEFVYVPQLQYLIERFLCKN